MAENKISILDIQNKKNKEKKIVMLTAYDYPIARLADEAGIDIILVSDALGMVGLGYKTTIPVTINEIVHHTKAVVRGTKNSLVLSTMPFMSIHSSISDALENAGRLMKEAEAQGIEVEGGSEIRRIVKVLVDAGVPVMPHIGLTRQYFSLFGKFRVQGRNASDALKIIDLALSLQEVGAFAILLECIPDRVAQIITDSLEIPTIGIGAGPYCDGQALVSQDMLGLFEQFIPKFVKRYLNLSNDIGKAFQNFIKDVESLKFPSSKHSFDITNQEFEKLRRLLEEKR